MKQQKLAEMAMVLSEKTRQKASIKKAKEIIELVFLYLYMKMKTKLKLTAVLRSRRRRLHRFL